MSRDLDSPQPDLNAARIESGKPVRVRFAPSPTGSLHVGGARTALFNWLFAHGEARRLGHEGTFLIRIEDTDQKRLVADASQAILDELRWFGLEWDEGPDKGGAYGPYTQSERTELYRQHAQILLERGAAYRCYCTPERLEAVRKGQQARKEPPGYDRFCRNLSEGEIAEKLAANEPFTVRFAMPLSGETVVQDLIRGPIVYQNANLDDRILLKSDGYPTYHLANVVDDHLMAISHILRGEEWISTAPLHVLLYQAFGWDVPVFVHQPLILRPDGKGKLSKRAGDEAAMQDFQRGGYLSEALMNYLVLLGWSFDAKTEVFSRDELLKRFTLERVNPAPARFDRDKLRWFNKHYINHILPVDELARRVVPFLAEAGLVDDSASDPNSATFALIRDASALLKDRLETLTDAPEWMGYFVTDDLAPYDPATLVPRKMEPTEVRAMLEAVRAKLDEVDLNDEAGTEAVYRQLAEELGRKPGQLFMPIRVAVTGLTQSPGLFETLRVIGSDRCKRRIDQAIAMLAAPVGGAV